MRSEANCREVLDRTRHPVIRASRIGMAKEALTIFEEHLTENGSALFHFE